MSIRPPAAVVLVALGFLPAPAQESPSFKLGEHVLNAGGHPSGGTVLASASHRITLDSVGEAAVGIGLGSSSYRMDGSFGGCYPPPGETRGLGFTDKQTLVWEAEPSAGDYNLYRDRIVSLSGLDYGTCLQQHLPGTTATDADAVPAGDGFFYLVTAENRLDEEGTKGSDSGGVPRGGSACP